MMENKIDQRIVEYVWGQEITHLRVPQETDEELNTPKSMDIDHETTEIMQSEGYSTGELFYDIPDDHDDVEPSEPHVALPFIPVFGADDDLFSGVSTSQLQAAVRGIDALLVSDSLCDGSKDSGTSDDPEPEHNLSSLAPKKHSRDKLLAHHEQEQDKEKKKGRKMLTKAQSGFSLKRKGPEAASQECKDPKPSFWKNDFDPKDPDQDGFNSSTSSEFSWLSHR